MTSPSIDHIQNILTAIIGEHGERQFFEQLYVFMRDAEGDYCDSNADKIRWSSVTRAAFNAKEHFK